MGSHHNVASIPRGTNRHNGFTANLAQGPNLISKTECPKVFYEDWCFVEYDSPFLSSLL